MNAPSNIITISAWSDAKTMKAFRKLSRRLLRKIRREIDPRILLLLCRMSAATERMGRGLSIQEAEQLCGFHRPVLEAMRNVGILDQQRGYERYESKDGSFATEEQMIPLFFVSRKWKQHLAPVMQLDAARGENTPILEATIQ